MNEYEKMKKEYIQGWHTWNTRSILSHVLMPEGFAVSLCLKDDSTGMYLKEVDIGWREKDRGQAVVFAGAHSYDEAYTQLRLKWNDIEIEVTSTVVDDDLLLLVKRLNTPDYIPMLIVETGILWNREGSVAKKPNYIHACLNDRTVNVFSTGIQVFEPYAITSSPYLALKLDEAVGISTGQHRTIEEIERLIAGGRSKHEKYKEKYGELSEIYNAMQTCLAWDTIYDPIKDRIISTVSRRWNKYWSGYVLFCWDNYFAACMAAPDSKEIAYSNIIEITREKTADGFVPNFASALGVSSRDRSQPPVGSLALKTIYNRYREKWLVEMLFDDLYNWNNWYYEHRQAAPGLLAWGSDPYTPIVGHYTETGSIYNRQGAAFESGLDNSPMYDDIPFNEQTHLMELFDVGLEGLYIMDCYALSELADEIGRTEQSNVLKERITLFEGALQGLWDNEDGFFYNKRSDNDEWNKRISPTNFYAMYSNNLTPEQVDRMIKEHFYNPNEFWGEYMLPSIARNDPAYPEQEYWRGRIWAPMNFLVYIALKKQGQNKAAKDLADNSARLILKEWLELGHVHENYCADTGNGCNKESSDGFYHWGGLLSLIALMDAGYV